MRRILLAAVPQGKPSESDFRMEDVAVPECPPNGILVRTTWISVDPYLRGRMTGNRSYIDPIPVGAPMESGAAGTVVASRSAAFQEGDAVHGMWGWQEFAGLRPEQVQRWDVAAPVSTGLGILGMPGMTAYFGLLELCSPKAGETLVVSGAAGAVGSAVAQIGKILDCRVIGIAGSEQKIAYLNSLGLDGAMNYRTDKPYAEKLAALCPAGIDCYFDNVGGEVTDSVFSLLNVRARVSLCGQISQYNDRSKDIGPRPFWAMVIKEIRAEGFLVSRWAARFPEGRKQMAHWLEAGRLQYHETIYEGFERTPQAFVGLFEGENTGKAVVRVYGN